MAPASKTQSQIIPKLIFPPPPANVAFHNKTPPSHDISSAGYHVTQQSLLLQLKQAIDACWPSRHQSRYVDVKVLLLSWSSDDLGVATEIDILMSVFHDAYRYTDLEHWKIPDKKPGHETNNKIAEFVQRGSAPGNLLIVYYAGHAMPNANNHGHPIWVANRTPQSPKFNSSMVQDYLCEVDDSSPDILLLYDCCHPANGYGAVESGRATIALLAACGFESIAAEVGTHSFTYALIQELSLAASQQRPISVPELHRNILQRLLQKRQNVVIREKDNKMGILTNNGVPRFELPVWRTPIYVQLSQNRQPRPIILAPQPTRLPATHNPGFIDLNAPVANSSTSAQRKNPIHVLLRVSIAEDEYDLNVIRDWICDAPPLAQEIQVVASLPSCSTLVLLQVPIEVWDMLPASPAISFVGFVRPETIPEPSSNRESDLKSRLTAISSELAMLQLKAGQRVKLLTWITIAFLPIYLACSVLSLEGVAFIDPSVPLYVTGASVVIFTFSVVVYFYWLETK